MTGERKLPWDWYDGAIPGNASIDDNAYLETAYSFHRYRSKASQGVRMGPGSAAYFGTVFDVGPNGTVQIGQFTLVHSAWFMCDRRIEIGDYTLISWNVVLLDSYRASADVAVRRQDLLSLPDREPRSPQFDAETRPILIGSKVWIGFDVCILPGVHIGDGCIIGARSVVMSDIPAYSVAAGNPARVVRRIERAPA
jgi:acetyltransferase-like isoleucine patch superfamily enzyme